MHIPERIFLAHAFLLVLSGCDHAQESEHISKATQGALPMVKQWVHGNYDNIAQAEADAKADLPPELMHRPMHQLFVPIVVPKLEGYIVFQQSSMDGSTSPALIFRHGLIQYIPDTDSEALLQRELYFKDAEPYKNAHMTPEILADITLDDLIWNAGSEYRFRGRYVDDTGQILWGTESDTLNQLVRQD